MNKNINYILLFLSLMIVGSSLLGCGGRGVDEVTITTTTTTNSTTTTTLPSVAAPTFVLASGSYEAPSIDVTIECSTATAEIYYTLDGSAPSIASNRYTGTFSLEASTAVKAIAVISGLTDSGISTANYDLYWWSPLGSGLSGGAGMAFSTVIDSSGNLYVGGSFNTAGGVLVNNIAKWNVTAQTWEAIISGGNRGANDSVNALLFDSFGNLYAGGTFTSIGGNAFKYIARWDGSTWSDLGYPGSNNISSILFDNSNPQNLYAGTLTKAYKCSDLFSLPHTWSSFGNTDSFINALAIDNTGKIYAGGSFSSINTVSNTKAIARWTPASSTWESVGTINKADNPGGTTVRAIIFDNSSTQNMYIGGDFNTIYDGIFYYTYVNNLARKNAGSWYTVGAGVNGLVTSLTLDQTRNQIYAGGIFTTTADGITMLNRIGKYDISTNTWHSLGTGMGDNSVWSIVIDPAGNVYAAGSFTTVGGIPAAGIARWGKI
jgi:hypothetical protein